MPIYVHSSIFRELSIVFLGGSAPQAASNGGGARAEDAAIQTLLELLCAGANIDRTNNDSECHYGIICDGCRREDFTGERYKCQICNDYDLCGACFRNGVSSKSHRTDHSMSKMPPRTCVKDCPLYQISLCKWIFFNF